MQLAPTANAVNYPDTPLAPSQQRRLTDTGRGTRDEAAGDAVARLILGGE